MALGGVREPPRPRKSSKRRRVSAAVKPIIALNPSSCVMFVAMLKPLVRSSIVTGETPVMKMRSHVPLNFLNQPR